MIQKLLLSSALLAACSSHDASTRGNKDNGATATKLVVDMSRPMPAGLDESSLDMTVNPCDDFYQYACGGWMEKTEIPGDKALTSRGFVAITDQNEQALKTILEEASMKKAPPETAFAKQMGDVYGSCVDEAQLNQSLGEVKKRIAQFTAAKSARDLAKTVGTLHASAVFPFFRVGDEPDLKNPTEVIAGLAQGGLGLPDRDYYTDDSERNKAIRASYTSTIEKFFKLLGESEAQAQKSASSVMMLETRLAHASLSRVEMRDPNKLYNRINRSGLKTQAANFAWDEYMTALGAKNVEAVNVSSVPFFVEVSAIAKDMKVEAVRPYLAWTFLRSSIIALPQAFQDEWFAYQAKNFTGAKEDRPRWKKCVAFSEANLDEAVGREFVRRHFPADSKAKTGDMVKALQTSFEKNLNTLPWMDTATREAALAKVRKMVSNNKIGYPEQWRDYSALKSSRQSFLSNVVELSRFEMARLLSKIGKPIDRTEWHMPASMVNAYYEPQMNEIVFPAGILQPPFFSATATDAVNFGAMGMVVGHEITHGFDDEGRKFAADGSLSDWWSASSAAAFVEKASCVKNQFDQYPAIENLKLNGQLTLGENVADLGGLKLAHAAMLEWTASRPTVANDAPRYTTSQQFFLGYAQSWCTKMRKEQAELRAKTDPHAPPYWRVNGPLGNLDAFRTAFMCTEKSKIQRSGVERCQIW